MKSTAIFLSGMLLGACALGLALIVFDRSEPTQAAASDPAGISDLSLGYSRSRNDRPFARYCCAPPHREERRADAVSHSVPLVEPDTERDVLELEPGAEWNALVGGMLEWEVQRRTGQKLTAEKKVRLLAELATLREASLALQQAPTEPDDPAEIRDRLTRTLALVQVDQAFRRELGLGAAEFLEGLDSSAIEVRSPVSSER